ncbi:MAG: OmpA family protein [Pseudomonadota bacterium]|nr:OmpA family protein [Pseudomonadota bacterium]
MRYKVGKGDMPFASQKASISRGSIPRTWAVSLLMASLLASGWPVLDRPAKSQDSLIIGSGQPQVQINEEAAYLRTYQPITASGRLPLFDPKKDTLKSRVIYLPPVISRVTNSQTKATSDSEKREASPVTVTNIEVNETEITSLPSSQGVPAPEVSGPETEPPIEQTPASSTNTEPGEKELAAIPPNQPDGISQEETSNIKSTSANSTTIIFNDGEKDIRPEETEKLTIFARELLRNDEMRLQLRSYASDTNESASAARRLSLARALAVRSFLIEAGVNSTRIDVRALGAKNERGPADRVDLVVAN